MKKELIATFLCLAMNSSFAFPLKVYAGLGLGIDQFAPERNVDDTLFGGGSTISKKNTDNATGANVTAFVGIKQPFPPQFALAAELSGTLSSAQTDAKVTNFINIANTTAQAKIRNRGSFSLSVLPSYYLTEKGEIFLRAGLARGRFEAKSSANTGGDLIATGSSSTWRSGYIVGLGLQNQITCNMAVRLEYDYSRYQSIRNQSTLPLALTGDLISSKVTPIDHMVTLSLQMNDFI